MATKKIRSQGGERQSALDAATQLMAEREKYEQWLDDLEAKKDSTPAKVFDRVRQDYVARLQTVMEQLGQYTATLQEHAENLVAKLRELEDAEEENEEEQAEAALRKQVGEMTPAEWESGSRKAQRELAKIKENQLVILTDLNRIRDLLGGDDDDAEPAKTSADFNELEFLSSVVGSQSSTSIPTPPAAAAQKKPTPQAPPAAVASAPPSPPKPRPTPTATAAPPAPPPAAPPPAAAAPAPPPPAPVVDNSPKESVEAPPPAKFSDAPNALRSSGESEQPKTLRCTECSAMNYPSEWYCERCGAELTVV